jgi:tetratricopeptide (TPR) repeat protein
VHTSLGNFMSTLSAEMDVRGAMEHYRDAEALLSQEPRSSSIAKLSAFINCGLAAAAGRALHTQEGLAPSRRAMEIAESLKDETLFARAATQQSLHLYYAGRFIEAFALVERAWQIADRLENAKPALAATVTGGGCYESLCDWRESQRWYQRELSKPRSANARHAYDLLSTLLREGFLLTGQVNRASAFASQMSLDRGGHSIGTSAFFEGRWEQAERSWTEMYERVRRAGGRDEAYGRTRWLSMIRRILGLHTQAEALLRDALSICRDHSLQYVEMWARPEWVLLSVELGRVEEATPHLARCREIIATGEDWRGLPGKVMLAEAVVAAAEERFDIACSQFDKAIEVLRFYQNRFEEAEAFFFWGRALNAAGEPARAVEKLEAAANIYRDAGAGERWIERAVAAMPRGSALHNGKRAPWPTSTGPRRLFRKDGDYWTVVFTGEPIRVKDAKGLHYIALLLRHPGMEFSAIELANMIENGGSEVAQHGRIHSSDPGIEVRADLGDAGIILDEHAKADYRRRLKELREELEEAERFSDRDRQQGLRAEIEALATELRAAVGRRGFDRKAASHIERARSSVSKRIRFALKQIQQADAAAGSHLSESIRTGHRCVYLPKQKVDWEF